MAIHGASFRACCRASRPLSGFFRVSDVVHADMLSLFCIVVLVVGTPDTGIRAVSLYFHTSYVLCACVCACCRPFRRIVGGGGWGLCWVAATKSGKLICLVWTVNYIVVLWCHVDTYLPSALWRQCPSVGHYRIIDGSNNWAIVSQQPRAFVPRFFFLQSCVPLIFPQIVSFRSSNYRGNKCIETFEVKVGKRVELSLRWSFMKVPRIDQL